MKLSFEGSECQSTFERVASPAGTDCRCGVRIPRKMLRGVNGGRTVPRNGFKSPEVRSVPMNFDMSDKQKEWLNRVRAFMARLRELRGA